MDHPLRVCLDTLATTSLAEVSSNASLLQRYDQKYATSITRAVDFIRSLGPEWKVQTISERPSQRYQTLYYDDPYLRSYHDHVKGRRNRFKIRVRSYEDGTSFLEVKLKTTRGLTDKKRFQRPSSATDQLSDGESTWLASLLPNCDLRTLVPALEVEYERITLHSPSLAERLTIDHSIQAKSVGDWQPVLKDGVIIESKSGSLRSQVSHELKRHGIHIVPFSKYCAGLSVVDESIHQRIRVIAERQVARE